VEILNEIFSSVRRSYEPPPQAARALAELGPLRVTDLGANIGLFALYALARWPVRELCSFEPDPANAALLHATIAANDEGPRWQLVASAISNEDTSALFQTGLYAESHLGTNHEGHGAIEVEVLDLFSRSPTDFLKMDIEGAEWAILEDPRLASYSARVIVLEWHKRMCPADDARTAARQLLRDAGYEPLAEDTAASAVNGVMWALRG
jgi:FkbM family methyltransferase